MGLKDIMAADAAIFLNANEFGDWITYNDADIQAVVEVGETQAAGNGYAGEGHSDRATVWVSAADVPNPKPSDVVINWRSHRNESDALGDSTDILGDETASAASLFTLFMGGVNWRVVRVVSSDGVMHELEVSGNEVAGWKRR